MSDDALRKKWLDHAVANQTGDVGDAAIITELRGIREELRTINRSLIIRRPGWTIAIAIIFAPIIVSGFVFGFVTLMFIAAGGLEAYRQHEAEQAKQAAIDRQHALERSTLPPSPPPPQATPNKPVR